MTSHRNGSPEKSKAGVAGAHYIRVSDEAIDDGGERASHGKSVASVTTNGRSYPCRDYHNARVVPLKLGIQTETPTKHCKKISHLTSGRRKRVS